MFSVCRPRRIFFARGGFLLVAVVSTVERFCGRSKLVAGIQSLVGAHFPKSIGAFFDACADAAAGPVPRNIGQGLGHTV